MKHFCHKICLVVLACFSYLSASAYDFEADGLYFTIISPKDLTVSVDGAVNKDTDKVVIPQTVVYKNKTLTITRVGSEAFKSYKNLQSISLPNTMLSIGESAFEEDELLVDVVLPDSLLRIGSNAFAKCTSLKTVRIPEKVVDLNDNVFAFCSSLESIKIPSNVTKIGYNAFAYCKSLRAIYVYAEKVPILPYNSCAFEGCDSKKCKVYVPIGTYDAYSRSEFGYFENIVEFDASSFRNTIATAENQDTTHYVVNDKKEHTH